MAKQETSGPGSEEEALFIRSMKRIREELGWSQGELARRMLESGWEGFYQTTISRIEAGTRPVRLGEARGIARALGALIGNMILPGEASKATRAVAISARRARMDATNLGDAAVRLLEDQKILRKELRDVQELAADDPDDPWDAGHIKELLASANEALSWTISGVIDQRFAMDDTLEWLGWEESESGGWKRKPNGEHPETP